jgi:ferredoxin
MTKISCLTLKKSTTLETQDNILDAFEKVSIDLPSGCRAGSCGVCAVEILKGDDQLTPMNSVEKNTLMRLYPEALQNHRKLRLACRAQRAIGKNSEIEIKSNLVDL